MAQLNWLITGASSGLGDALGKASLERGDQVAATFRKPEQAEAFSALAPGRAHGIVMDVTDKLSVDRGVAQAAAAMGNRLDVVVNNAGYALHGLVEQISDEEAEMQMQTNFFGVLRVVRATLPHFRAQKNGRYINVASLAGTMGFPGMSLYCASKFALQGFTEALGRECATFGALAVSVEPGGFQTNFGTSSMISAAATVPGTEYDPLLAHFAATRESMAASMQGDPVKEAARIVELATMDCPPNRLALGDDALPMIKPALEARIAEYVEFAELGTNTSIDRD
jgi:NAD(P)-dependent dehydrogenase (short-subunit alcohol dehydrogenase family)